jgi:hypothetical protein
MYVRLLFLLKVQARSVDDGGPPCANVVMGCNEVDADGHLQVRAHAENPVAWQLWAPGTLALAKKHNRVLFVSIGYAACHCNISPNISLGALADFVFRQGVM